MTERTAKTWLVIVAVSICLPLQAWAVGAWVIESRFNFTTDAETEVVLPFVDEDGTPWVLGNDAAGACLLIGPFDVNSPTPVEWHLPPEEGSVPPAQCTNVLPGPDGGFVLRGQVPAAPQSQDPDLGFTALLDANFDTLWVAEDAPYVELGVYGVPLPQVAWSEQRGRVLSFFLGLVNIGEEGSVGQLHGLAIADGTGLIRRTVASWGDVTAGELQGVLVTPTDERFLVAGHSNGTEFLLYDGIENIDGYMPGRVDWSGETVDYMQFASDGDLFLLHHERLDLFDESGTMTRVSEDGSVQRFSLAIDKQIELEEPTSGRPIDVVFPRPVLSYITDSTATLVRRGGVEFVLHIYDPHTGDEVAIQPLSSIDEDNQPTHMADGGGGDRLILMTGAQNPDGSVQRFVNVITWDADLETPGAFPQPGAETPGDGFGELDAGEGGSSEEQIPDIGCCQTAPRAAYGHLLLVMAGLMLFRMRRLVTVIASERRAGIPGGRRGENRRGRRGHRAG